MPTPRMPAGGWTLKTGDLAYLDPLRSRLVPCKVVEVANERCLTVEVTGARPGYALGERITFEHPRSVVHRRQVYVKNGHYMISGVARWIPDEDPHVDYPHYPGRLYDCPACEARCHCTPDAGTTECIFEGKHQRFGICSMHNCGEPAVFVQAGSEAEGVGRWTHIDPNLNYGANGRGHVPVTPKEIVR